MAALLLIWKSTLKYLKTNWGRSDEAFLFKNGKFNIDRTPWDAQSLRWSFIWIYSSCRTESQDNVIHLVSHLIGKDFFSHGPFCLDVIKAPSSTGCLAQTAQLSMEHMSWGSSSVSHCIKSGLAKAQHPREALSSLILDMFPCQMDTGGVDEEGWGVTAQ